jgi:hypothetical protein
LSHSTRIGHTHDSPMLLFMIGLADVVQLDGNKFVGSTIN